MDHTKENIELLLACIFQTVAIVLALSTLIMCIVFEIQCNRIEKQIDQARMTPFSDEVNDGLEMTLDIKAEILNAGKQ